jgi:hypothetical protein
MAEERRIIPRRRVLKAGSISFGGGAIDCTVRNISDTGAILEVLTSLFVPDRFKLIIQSDGGRVISSGGRNDAWALRLIEPTKRARTRARTVLKRRAQL